MTRAKIMTRTLSCIRAVAVGCVDAADCDTGIVEELYLGGKGLLRLGELLEQEFAVTIGCDELLDVALNSRPSIRHLVDLVEGKLHAA